MRLREMQKSQPAVQSKRNVQTTVYSARELARPENGVRVVANPEVVPNGGFLQADF
jgi:hypothetical protein